MAFENTHVPYVPITVQAVADLRSHQHKAAIVTPTGVILATGGITSGYAYPIQSKSNSGDDVSLSQAPNVAKALAGLAVVAGNPIAADATSAYWIPTSLGNPYCAGHALESVASGSVFALQLR